MLAVCLQILTNVRVDSPLRAEALRSATEAARLAPEEPMALYALCQAQLVCQKNAEARETAAAMLELSPHLALSHQAMVLVCIREQKWREAEAHCRQALSLKPDSSTSMNNLGVALSNAGRKVDAAKCFYEAYRLNPSDNLARHNLDSTLKEHLKPSLDPRLFWFIFLGPSFCMLGAPLALVVAVITVGFKLCRMEPGLRGYAWRQMRQSLRYSLPSISAGRGSSGGQEEEMTPEERARHRRDSALDICRGLARLAAVAGLVWTVGLLAQVFWGGDTFKPSGWFAWVLFVIACGSLIWELIVKVVRLKAGEKATGETIIRLNIDGP
jgi:tetratricopeptide (TPR) repeat protein